MTDLNKAVEKVKKDLEDSGVKPNPSEVKQDILTRLSDELLEDVSGGQVHLNSGHVDVKVT